MTSLTAPPLNQNIRAFSPGALPAKGCVTAQIVAAGPVPVQPFIDQVYIDSKQMSLRPGMLMKYTPYSYDTITGQLLTGGAYLFDEVAQAKDYARWVGEEFEVDQPKVKFSQRGIFESFKGRAWSVVGACAFGNVEEHAVTRLQVWSCGDKNVEETLKALYPSLREGAEAPGISSVWLLYDPESNDVGLQIAFNKVGEADYENATRTLEVARGNTVLGEVLTRELHLKRTFDRASLVLLTWLPKSRAAGGTELAIPNYPLVPEMTVEHV